jgi:putative nucleotidyltransferase with HDIG domain
MSRKQKVHDIREAPAAGSFQHWYLNQMIHALVKAIGLRDVYTARHLLNVSQLARAIARGMGLPREQVENIRLAGVLHDIGNMGIPLEILQKERQLTRVENNLVRQHPQIAYEILSEPDFPLVVAQAVFQHHERLDGSGYPQGLSGKNICLEAQVVAVADVFDTIVSRRPYKDAASANEALDELDKHSGTLFNGDAVDACIRLIRNGDMSLPFCASHHKNLRRSFSYGAEDDARS